MYDTIVAEEGKHLAHVLSTQQALQARTLLQELAQHALECQQPLPGIRTTVQPEVFKSIQNCQDILAEGSWVFRCETQQFKYYMACRYLSRSLKMAGV